MASACLENLVHKLGWTETKILKNLTAQNLQGLHARHPLHAHGFHRRIPLLEGEHVTLEKGTGLVHTAPDHGVEDFLLGQKHNLPLLDLLTPQGIFKAEIALVGGQHFSKVAPAILEALQAANFLSFQENFVHSYPHSWRSKKPLIYRATRQWFLHLDKQPKPHTLPCPKTLRQGALGALETIRFIPENGKKRLSAMLQNRPDWCLSRQRLWGIPLMLFVNSKGELLVNPDVNEMLLSRVKQEGSHFWWTDDADTLLKPFGLAGYTKVMDIIDVWFESGMTHQIALTNLDSTNTNDVESGHWPADLYLEGSDQHRGWFQSSLVLSQALWGKAPYKTLLTHGFIVDQTGQKMSKSGGNNKTPQEFIEQKGADMLRLWVAGTTLVEDATLNDAALHRAEEFYRRFRNTLRFLLGNLSKTQPEDLVDLSVSDNISALPLIERWVLHRLTEVRREVAKHFKSYDFSALTDVLYLFCHDDLSALYFDIRKDTLYCEAFDSLLRRQVCSVLFAVLRSLLQMLSPLLVFTTEEALSTAHADLKELTKDWPQSVHLWRWQHLPECWHNTKVKKQFQEILTLRQTLTSLLEAERKNGRIHSFLEASACVKGPLRQSIHEHTSPEELATYCLVSEFQDNIKSQKKLVENQVSDNTYLVTLSQSSKCKRCWRYLASAPDKLCTRCEKVTQTASIFAESAKS